MITGIRALSVKQLNLYVKSLLEGDAHLQNVAVTGELSNFKDHYASGHFYFTLKDADTAIKCVMFRSFASRLTFRPADGMRVVLRGRASLYEKDGQYQFYAEEMYSAGIGDITLQFEQIKAKLNAEGLFDEKNKRPLPKFPRRIAVVTSDTGAAVQDIKNILARRWPVCEVLLCPVPVQGQNAVPEMLSALDGIYESGNADIIIIGRGGGSAEDLWAFNSEELARKLYESPVPVISAVGHETDFTICDFVSDLRAPTPSAAAELAVPDAEEIYLRLLKFRGTLKNSLYKKYELSKARLERLNSSIFFKQPEDALVNSRRISCDRAAEHLKNAFDAAVKSRAASFASLAAKLDSLSPLKVMARGYAAALKNGRALTSAAELEKGDRIRLEFKDGSAVCTVNEKELKS